MAFYPNLVSRKLKSMPRIFEKDCKIKIIEYGTPHFRDATLDEIRAALTAFLARVFRPGRTA